MTASQSFFRGDHWRMAALLGNSRARQRQQSTKTAIQLKEESCDALMTLSRNSRRNMNPFPPRKPFANAFRRSMLGARKTTQARLTKAKVASQPRSVGSFSPALCQSRCTARAAPCSAPQSTKVHAAPCQRPPSRKVIPRLLRVRHAPRLFPPSGI